MRRRGGLLTLALAARAYTAPPLFAEAPETTLAIHPRWPCHGDDNKCFNSGVLPAVRDHAWYRPSMHYAQIVLVCLRSVRMPLRNATGRGNLHNRPVIRPGTAHDLMKLPRRHRGHYVIYVNNAQFDSCVWDYTESCREWYDLIRTRHDFLYANIDLGDHRACDDAPLPGVALLPRALRNGAGARFPVEPEAPRKVLVSFVGKNHIGFYNSSTVRPDLLAAYEKWSGDKKRVVVNGLLHRSDRMSKVQYQELLRASEFGLLPRGDERQATPCGPHRGDGVEDGVKGVPRRWSWRFGETMNAGVIPVILADGMSLPYSHLVDWPQARLILPEALAKNFSAVVETVAAVSKGRKARMRAKVRLIYNECMATDARLADCFLRDLSLAVRAPHREAALKAAESLRGPDCPSHNLDEAGENPRYGWSVG